MKAVAILGAALLGLTLLAGCHEEDPDRDDAGERYTFAGAFTAEATQEEIDTLRTEVESRGGDLLVLESFPMQYQARKLGQADCDAVRAVFDAHAAVATADDCRVMTTTTDGDTATGAPG